MFWFCLVLIEGCVQFLSVVCMCLYKVNTKSLMLWRHVNDCVSYFTLLYWMVDCDDSVERSNMILLVIFFLLFPMAFWNFIKV